jgi:hypothetical protein
MVRNATESELLTLSLSALSSMCFAGHSAALLSGGVMASVVASLAGYLAEADLPPLEASIAGGLVPAATGAYAAGGPDAEAVAVVEAFLGLAAQAIGAAHADAAALGDGGVCALLLRALPAGLPTPAALRRAYLALGALARTAGGVARVLAEPEALDKLLFGASTVYAAPRAGAAGGGAAGGGAAGGGARSGSGAPAKSVRELLQARKRSSVALEGGGGSGGAPPPPPGGAAPPAADAAKLNAHMEPAFRLLHRLSLTPAGLAALREPGRDTVAVLAPAVDCRRPGSRQS